MSKPNADEPREERLTAYGLQMKARIEEAQRRGESDGTLAARYGLKANVSVRPTAPRGAEATAIRILGHPQRRARGDCAAPPVIEGRVIADSTARLRRPLARPSTPSA